jgi:hypothetical protein
VGDGDAVPARRRTGASFPDQPRAGKHRAARVHAVRRQHRLCRGLGAVFREPVEGTRHGDRSVSADGGLERRDAARDAAGSRQRHPCQGLDPRSVDRLHARQFADGADRRDCRGRTVHRSRIARTKAKAQAALGAKFDPRDFHAQVLDTGSLPMPVLERKIDAWIAAGGGAAK